MCPLQSDDLFPLIDKLWQLKRSDINIYQCKEFVELQEFCINSYDNVTSGMGLNSGLRNLLKSLGMPFFLPECKISLAIVPIKAAAAFHEAMVAKSSVRIHLCPLDLADEIPDVEIGPIILKRFSEKELSVLANAPRLERVFPNLDIDWGRLACFQWVVVTETVELANDPGKRVLPWMEELFDQDVGAFKPHANTYPESVEDVLFLLLLAPWEDWSVYKDVFWKGFNIPWIFTNDSDLLLQIPRPPDPDLLSWQPDFICLDDREIEIEKPVVHGLNEGVQDFSKTINNVLWRRWTAAKETEFFDTPVLHFLIRGFQDKDMDEFISHLLVIEAALGLQADFNRSEGPKKYRAYGSKKRVSMRISKLLDDSNAGEEYMDLYKLRNNYIHGRSMDKIFSKDMMKARKLARRIVLELLTMAVTKDIKTRRDTFLMNLLD